MNTLLNICHTIVFVFLLASIIDMSSCTIAYAFKKASISRIKNLEKTALFGIIMYLLFNIGYYFLGIILVSKGELIMKSSDLIMSIAQKMHWASIAFVVAALIVTAVTIFAALADDGNISELKKLLGNCIVIAIIFWILAWLII